MALADQQGGNEERWDGHDNFEPSTVEGSTLKPLPNQEIGGVKLDFVLKNDAINVKFPDYQFAQLKETNFSDANKVVYKEGNAEIDNGYSTGYEMLHRINFKVRGFQIHGKVEKINETTFKYTVTIEWHEIIDSNDKYGGDTLLSEGLEHFYDPKNYEIHIKWDDTFIIKK